VATTGDPHAAIQIASSEKIDLAILDYSMPIMDGGQLSTELKRLANFPMIIVSGDLQTLIIVGGLGGSVRSCKAGNGTPRSEAEALS
jgi:CheY-like chemotaxis protein